MNYTNTIINKDALEGVKMLPDESIDSVVTSPPYFGLRDYGIEGQIGLEETPEEYTDKIVSLFREIKRVLKKEGTVWLNLGDSYAQSGGSGKGEYQARHTRFGKVIDQGTAQTPRKAMGNLKPKDLIGIPWRVAFALQADGWYLRQDIIWAKPNPMPESVKDRCTKSHEYIFLLSKSPKYYYDAESIKEDSIDPESFTGVRPRNPQKINQYATIRAEYRNFHKLNGQIYEKKNKRSVWTVNTHSYKEAHFATYPPQLIKPCILAGCPEGGTVLDPFMGSGTTAVVARKLNRNYIGIELNPEYVRLAEKRIYNEIGLFQ